MTSRTIDIHCCNCRRYLFSEWPGAALDADVYCDRPKCAESATAAKLEGKKVVVHEDR